MRFLPSSAASAPVSTTRRQETRDQACSGISFRGLLPSQSASRLVAGRSLLAVTVRAAHRVSPAATSRVLDFEVSFLAKMRCPPAVLPALGIAPLFEFLPLWDCFHLPVPQALRRGPEASAHGVSAIVSTRGSRKTHGPWQCPTAFSVLLGSRLARRLRLTAPPGVSSRPSYPFQSN